MLQWFVLRSIALRALTGTQEIYPTQISIIYADGLSDGALGNRAKTSSLKMYFTVEGWKTVRALSKQSN